jgi:hypothetical protein
MTHDTIKNSSFFGIFAAIGIYSLQTIFVAVFSRPKKANDDYERH